MDDWETNLYTIEVANSLLSGSSRIAGSRLCFQDKQLTTFAQYMRQCNLLVGVVHGSKNL